MGVQTWLRRQNVINGRESKTSPGSQKDAEVFGMAIGRADQPKKNLRLDECLLVGGGDVTAFLEN